MGMMSETGAAACDIVQLCDVKTLDSVNSLKLVDLARAGVTGELVCSCERRGARIYLQAGRVAWASDCRFHRAFTSHLKQHARLDPPAIEAVVAECRATKRPIGEMLVERRLATEEQVRAALRHQIEFALHIGECQGEGRTAFIPRSYGAYDVRFTFEVSELLSEEGTVLSELPPRVLAWPRPRSQGCGSPPRSAAG